MDRSCRSRNRPKHEAALSRRSLVFALAVLTVDTRGCDSLSSHPNLGTGSTSHASPSGEGSDYKLTEIRLKKGEPVEKALRRLKKKIDREGTLRVVRSHRHYEKPSEKRRRKQKAARFSAMLTARYADL